jgi:hypothetical protein
MYLQTMRTGKVEIEREGDREQWNCTEGDRDKLREDAIDRCNEVKSRRMVDRL